MKPTRFSFLTLLLAATFLLTAFLPHTNLIPVTGTTPDSTPDSISNLPDLGTFSTQVKNGKANQITGLFASDTFALSVVQQPAGHAEYVDRGENTATQFSLAGQYGSLGFLAHNFLAGQYFSSLQVNGLVSVVYGDGHTQTFEIVEIRQFQVLTPNSPYSDFIDLATGTKLSYVELFFQTYGVSGNMILQTCIEKDGEPSWGRTFIIAHPYTPQTLTSAPSSVSNQLSPVIAILGHSSYLTKVVPA